MTHRLESMNTPIYNGEYEHEAPKVQIDEPTVAEAIVVMREEHIKLTDEAWMKRVVSDSTLSVEVPVEYEFNQELLAELASLPDEWKQGARKEDRPPPPVFDGMRTNIPGSVYASGVKWEVGKRIDKGSFGSVYEVAHGGETQKDRLVKIITVKGGERDTSNRLGFLWNEVGAAMATGDYLCSEIIQDEEGNSMLALIMERYDGKTMGDSLYDKKRGETWPLNDEKWMYQLSVALRSVVSTLRKMHSQGWIHRDVKPANVMVPESTDDAMLAHLIDYGTAIRQGSVRAKKDDVIVGTPFYMLPETMINEDIDLRIRDYWAAMVSIAKSAGLVIFNKDMRDINVVVNGLANGSFLISPDLSNAEGQNAFFDDEEITGAHREFLQWLHDFLQPHMDYKSRLALWQREGVVEQKAPTVKVRHAGEVVERGRFGLFINDDKFVRELDAHIRGLAEQAGVQMPEGMIESFQEFPAEA